MPPAQLQPRYTDAEMGRALAIYDSCHSYVMVERETGISKNTLMKWLEQRKRDKGTELSKETNPSYLLAYESQKDTIMKHNISLQLKALRVIEGKLNECSAAQAATIYGILHDKLMSAKLVDEGIASGNTNTVNMLFTNVNSDQTMRVLERVAKRVENVETPTD